MLINESFDTQQIIYVCRNNNDPLQAIIILDAHNYRDLPTGTVTILKSQDKEIGKFY